LSSVPEFIGKAYRLHEKLGEGSMGSVYRATHRLTGRIVALKRVRSMQEPEDVATENTARESPWNQNSIALRMSLAEEFQTLASLRHPHIVAVLDYGFDEQQDPYFTMELLRSPKNVLDWCRNQPIDFKIKILVHLLRALTYLHHRGVLHRDIKPSNVLVEDNQLKLLDFGIANAIGASTGLAGTLEYMAPELFLGRPATPASDLYSVGVLAYELLTNRFPHNVRSRTHFLQDVLGENSDATLIPVVVDLITARNFGTPVARDLDEATLLQRNLVDLEQNAGALAAIVTRLLAKDPADRYRDAAAVIRDLGKALGQSLPVETVETRESFLQAASFVGREIELAHLLDSLKAAQAGQGSVLMISGESGVGKSRLVSELRTRALVRSARVVSSQCQKEPSHSYQLWSKVLRELCLYTEITSQEIGVLKDIVPDIEALLDRVGQKPEPLPPQAAQARLRSAIEALFRRQTQLVLVLLEDLQWAELESLELLARLTSAIQSLPVLVVGTYRSHEAQEALRSLRGTQTIPLERLTELQIQTLCESMLGTAVTQPAMVQYLHRQTAGNAFFLVEVLRALATMAGQLDLVSQQELPEQLLTGGIEQLLERRLAQLPETDQAVLEVAAVAGRRLDERVLAHASGRQELSAWHMLCANAGILEAAAGIWYFAHDKMREFLLSRLGETRKQQIHRQVAESITAVYPDTTSHDAELAYHWNHADVPENAYICYLKAAQAASRLFIVAEARAHFSAALSLLARLPDTLDNRRRRVDTLIALTGVSLYAAKLDLILAHMSLAESLLDSILQFAPNTSADQARLAKVYFYRGRGYFVNGEVSQSIGSYEKTRQLAEKCGEKALYALSTGVIGHALVCQGRMGLARQYLTEAVAYFEPIGAGPDWGRMLAFLGVVMVAQGDVEQGFAHLDRVVKAAQDPTSVMLSHGYSSLAGLYMLDWGLMHDLAQKAVVIARQNDDQLIYCSALWLQAWSASMLGKQSEAEECQHKAHALFAKRGTVLNHDQLCVADADISLNGGHIEQAIANCQKAMIVSQNIDSIFGQGLAHRTWAAALAAQTPPDWAGALQHAEASLRFFEQGEAWLMVAHAHMILGKLAYGRGDLAKARAHRQKAAAQFAKSGLVDLLAEAQSHQAQNASERQVS